MSIPPRSPTRARPHPPWQARRVEALPRTPAEWFELWLAIAPDGSAVAPRAPRAALDGATKWFDISRRRRWYGSSELVLTPRTDAAIRAHVPSEDPAGSGGYGHWNRQRARAALNADRDLPARAVGICIPSDDETAVRPLRLLSLLDLFCPPGLVFRAMVVTGSAALAAALRQRAPTAFGGLASVDVVHDVEPFRFARRVNRGARPLLALHPDLHAVVLANDDTAPTAAACARMAEWPTANSLVGAVSNEGGGGLQTIDAPSGDPCDDLVVCPHRLCGYFLYVTRDVWSALDGFDEDYAGYGCDDTAFSIRAHALGARILVDPAAFVWHESGATFGREAIARLHPEALAIFRRKHPEISSYVQPLPLPPSLPPSLTS